MIVPRPLTIGEIFDRGITLFVRNAPLVLALAALYYVPHAIVDGYDSSAKGAIGDLVTLATNPSAAGAASARSAKPVFDAWAVIRVADFLFVLPLLNAVLVAVLAFAYRGAAPTFVAALRTGIARWRASVVAWLALLVSFLVAAIPLVIVVALPGILAAGAALGVRLSPAGVGIVVGIVVTPFALLAFAVLFFLMSVSNLAECAVVVEGSHGLRAFATAWRRALRMPRRAILMSAVQIVVSSISGIIANAIGDTIVEVTHVVPLAITANAATEMAVICMLIAISVVYYEDQRVRSDGNDLLAAVMPVGASSGSFIA